MKSCLAIETSNTNSCIKCYNTFNHIFIFSGGRGRGIFAYKIFVDRGCTWQGQDIQEKTLKHQQSPSMKNSNRY
jgi:hypothetical protein